MAENLTAYRDLVRFRSSMPENVRQAAVQIKSLWLSAPTYEEACEYCKWVEDGGPYDGRKDLEVCEHYDRLEEAIPELLEVEGALTEDEQGLLRQDDRLKFQALYQACKETEEPKTNIPEGYYAVIDPWNEEEITYWRKKVKKPGKRGAASFAPWPNKARYGPQLTRGDLPAPPNTEEGTRYIRAWLEVVQEPYRDAIVEAILEDPVAAGQRFADWAVRCCCCGKALTNDLSKVYGIGPECRKGMFPEVLANYYRPAVGRAHAAHVDGS